MNNDGIPCYLFTSCYLGIDVCFNISFSTYVCCVLLVLVFLLIFWLCSALASSHVPMLALSVSMCVWTSSRASVSSFVCSWGGSRLSLSNWAMPSVMSPSVQLVLS